MMVDHNEVIEMLAREISASENMEQIMAESGKYIDAERHCNQANAYRYIKRRISELIKPDITSNAITQTS